MNMKLIEMNKFSVNPLELLTYQEECRTSSAFNFLFFVLKSERIKHYLQPKFACIYKLASFNRKGLTDIVDA